MDTKQPEAIRIAEWLEGIRGNTWPSYIPQEAAAELRRQHAEIETLRAGYDAARLEIVSLRERVQMLGQMARDVNSRRVLELEAQLAAIGAGGVEPLRKRECLHQISEPAKAGWCDGCNPDNCSGCATPAAPAQAGEYPPLVCDYCGALTPDPWHSSGMLHGKMSKHIHSCDSCVVEAEVQKQDEALIWLMLTALEHHTEQTRPIARTDDAITAALLRLKGKP